MARLFRFGGFAESGAPCAGVGRKEVAQRCFAQQRGILVPHSKQHAPRHGLTRTSDVPGRDPDALAVARHRQLPCHVASRTSITSSRRDPYCQLPPPVTRQDIPPFSAGTAAIHSACSGGVALTPGQRCNVRASAEPEGPPNSCARPVWHTAALAEHLGCTASRVQMDEPLSTETLINSFPMFGHPGISALEYAGSLAAPTDQSRRASVPFPSLKRKTHNDNTNETPSAASVVYEAGLPLDPVRFRNEFGVHRRPKDMFVNHTPRQFNMRAPQNIEVYRPSTSSSNENYSRPRINSQASRCSSAGPAIEKRLTVNSGSPFELDATEVGVASSPLMFASSPPMSPDVYRPMAAPPQRRSLSSPMTKIITYQPRQARAVISNSHQKREVRVRSTSKPDHDLKEKKHSRRQTPYKVVGPAANTGLPYASLEPWVAKHQRDASRSDTNSDRPTQEDLEKLEEVAPLGVIQKYFDSQADSRDLSLKRVRHRHTPSPPKMPLPHSQDPLLRSREPVVMFPMDDLELITDLPPAVPERSPKRLTNPRFPFRKESVASVDSDFARAAAGQYEQRASEIRMPKQRSQPAVVGQAARAGSSCLGRMAPPILGHDALTASSDLGLNDLSFYLRNTGPSTDIPTPGRQHARGGPKIFKVKRKSLAARVGSVEGSPQRARQKPKVVRHG
ncbi:hypothetical protein OPT61_g7984 [Boeremia exigua]|uniref:Uncharacterized protein n=1 Tax=Boeremia exigua TaxID=749465 RepID=A0ACC2I032_9PLEO|nr:hypothetical protein OPT61_g7984 [Boeremia exigua]